MKKILTWIFILILAVTSFIGCGPKPDYYNVSLTLWHYYNDVQKTVFDKFISDFNDTVGVEKGIVITAKMKSSKTYEYSDALVSAANGDLNAEAMPDIFLAYPDTALTLDKLGKVAELDNYFTAAELDEYVVGFIEEGRIDASGKLKNFPIAKSTEIFQLNRTDWDKFAAEVPGVSIDKLQTIEGLIEMSELYYNKYGKAFFGRDSLANYFIIGAKQLGIELFSVDAQGNMVLNADNEVIRKLWDSYYVPYLKGYFAVFGQYRTDDLKTKTIISSVGSSAGAAYVPNTVIDNSLEYSVSFDIFAAPSFAGGGAFAFQQGAGFSVTKTSDENKIKAAVEFLKWFTQTERNIEFAVQSSYLPVKKAALDFTKIQQVVTDKQLDINHYSLEGLKASISIVNSNTMYVNKPSVSATAARQVLEASLNAKGDSGLNAIRSEIAGKINQGYSANQATEQYTNNNAFEAWYAKLIEDLNNV